jgi:hypothetical protein
MLHLLALLSAKAQTGRHDIVAIFLMNVREIFRARVGQ